MSIATEITRLQGAKASLKTAIENKGVTVSSSALIDAYPALVDSIPTGGGAVEEKTVNFVDFDGTLVASYTGEEVQALTALPDAPDHSSDTVPLTFDEWNWTLSEIKSNNTSYPNAIITVGANYHTTDGKYHFWFDSTGLNECIVAFQAGASGTVDWGDGSTVESFSSSGVVEHNYSNGLKNHCIVDCSGIVAFNSGSKSQSKGLALTNLRLPSQCTSLTIYNCRNVEDVSIPSVLNYFDYSNNYKLRCIVFPRAFTTLQGSISSRELRALSFSPLFTTWNNGSIYETSLTSLFIPGISSIGSSSQGVFKQNQELCNVCIPNLVLTNLNAQIFQKCYNLNEFKFSSQNTLIPNECFEYCGFKKINIPNGIDTIWTSTFSNCSGVLEVTIPASVTTINNYAFSGVKPQYITVLATTPPSLGSSNFGNTYLQKIYVPYSSDHSVLAAYQAASNWSNYASYMEELPE